MLTAEAIQNVNQSIKPIDIKGKNYAVVSERIKAFRAICPNGRIITKIISLKDGVVIMEAEVMDDEGNVLANGLAYEKENSTFINQTSFIENCQTGAIGRALGILGIGVSENLASFEEVANAINNQNKPQKANNENLNQPITDEERKTLEDMAADLGWDCATIANWPNITKKQYAQCMKEIKAASESKGKA